MEKETLDLYSPANAKNLTAEQLEAMANFTKEDLKQLAAAYPNSNHVGGYLILFERGKTKQIGHPSTWNNLYNLVKMGSTNYYAATFRSIFKPTAPGSAPVKPMQKAKDITNEQAKELLKGANQQAKEVKEPKEPIDGEEKTAAQIAAEEGKALGGEKETPAKTEKPLNKMNLTELTAKYKEVFEEAPETGSTKAQLIAAIESKD